MEECNNKQVDQRITLAEWIFVTLRTLLYVMIGIYMILILVVLPFYNSEGYAHIGTDKAEFFLKSSIYCGGLLLPVLLLAGIAKIIVLLQKYGWAAWYNLDYPQVAEYLQKRFSVTDCFAICFGITVLISYFCSEYRQEALWGTEYWYMGTLTQLSLVIVYFCVSRAGFDQKWIAVLILPVSAVVFALGYLNRFEIYPIDMKVHNVQFISTIGNLNWYCGYLVSIFFGGFYVFCRSEGQKLWQRLLLGGYVIVGFATLITQGSSSGIVTLIVILLVLFRRFAPGELWMMNFWKGMLLLSLVCLTTNILRWKEVLQMIYVVTISEIFTNSPLPIVMTVVSVLAFALLYWCKKKIGYPKHYFERLSKRLCSGVLILLGVYVVLLVVNAVGNGIITKVTPASFEGVFTFSPAWGSNRGATWMAGVCCFAEQDFLHMLVGVGPDCMSAFLYGNGSEGLVAMVRNSFGMARLTNAHNEWLTVLVNMGVLGCVSYAGMMISAIRRFLNASEDSINGKQNNRGAEEVSLLVPACGFCLLAYTVNNMFSFQQAMSVSTIFVLMGMGENALRRKKLEASQNVVPDKG